VATQGERMPIFPLSNVVLFPQLATPLHLFEPRYRQLGRDALAGDRKIGMVVVRPEFADAMAGDPPVFPIGCAGTVTESQRLPDGRYNIVLRGDFRFRVVEEETRREPRLYRVARVVRLVDGYDEADRERVAALRTRLLAAVGTLLREMEPERAAGLRPELFEGVDDVTLVNLLCNAFALPVEDKQALLEADTIPERYARLESVLAFEQARRSAADRSTRRPLH
jgi:Lon protease-like protein